MNKQNTNELNLKNINCEGKYTVTIETEGGEKSVFRDCKIDSQSFADSGGTLGISFGTPPVKLFEFPIYTSNLNDYKFTIEDGQGNLRETSMKNFTTTGYVPSWDQTKEQVLRDGPNSLGLVGFFMTPSGTTAESSRFGHYLQQEQNAAR